MPFRLIHIFFLFVMVQSMEGVWSQEEGLASYYHKRFHGRKSSSGRIYNADELVAAHRTYPFGTFLRVTNLSNMKTVIVCVTDRGPRRKNRIVDLSYAAAEKLDFIKKGLTRVRIEVVPSGLDLRYLELICPEIPYLGTEHLRPVPPYKLQIKKYNNPSDGG